jgi:hypothetical protein
MNLEPDRDRQATENEEEDHGLAPYETLFSVTRIVQDEFPAPSEARSDSGGMSSKNSTASSSVPSGREAEGAGEICKELIASLFISST